MKNFKVTDDGLNKETGYNKDRGCTDFLCLIIFLAFLGSLVGCSIWGAS